MAADGTLKIRIGAAMDRSIDTVFGGIEKRALKTRDNINKALGGGSLQKSFGGIEQAARRSADNTDKIWNAELAKLNRIARAQDRINERVESNKVRLAEKAARERQRIEERAARDVARAHRDAARIADREAAQSERTRRQFAERTAWRATKFLVPPPMGAIGVGRRIAGDMLRGAGIDFSLQGSVQRAVSLQQQAVQLANSAYIPGVQGLASQRLNPAEIERFVRETAPKFGMSSGDTMEALKGFVGRTGDFATAKATLPGLLKLGAATGTDPQDLLTFAGTVGATAFDSPAKDAKEAAQRAEFLNRTLNVAAYSGKLGTTEISDLAKYGPKLAATAQAFGGDKEKNLGEMYALAQLGLKGGAASAAQATTSVASMVNTLKTPARRKQFKANGVELEDENGQFRSASDIITDSIVAAGKDTEKFKKMWANVQGARSVEGLRNTYLQAGGGQAGVAAIRGQFKQLGGSMSQDEIDKSSGDYLNTIGAKAKSFQERWDDVIGKMSKDLLPSLEKLADPTIKLAGIFADVAKFAADMPVTFGGLVVAAAVLRAGIESWARAALEKRIVGLPTGTVGVPGTGPAGSSAGPAGIGGIFTGGGGYGGVRGVMNSQAMAFVAPMAAAAAIDLARDQASSFSQENGGMSVTGVAWEALANGSLFDKGLGGMFDVVDAKMNADAKARAEEARKVAAPGAGDAQGKNSPPLSAEDMQRALEGANSRGIRITNWPPNFGNSGSGPVVGPEGRQSAPGR